MDKSGLYEPLIAFLVRWRNHLRGNYSHDVNYDDFLDQFIPCGSFLNRDVVQRRRRDLLETVDTGLLKCYQMTNIARIGPLLRRENYCSLEVAEQILKGSGCIKDLITVYNMRGLHSEALRCLTSEIQEVDSPPKKRQFSYQDIAKYLQHLEGAPFDLVVEFGEVLLHQYPRIWMSIFMHWECQIRRYALSLSKRILLDPKFLLV